MTTLEAAEDNTFELTTAAPSGNIAMDEWDTQLIQIIARSNCQNCIQTTFVVQYRL